MFPSEKILITQHLKFHLILLAGLVLFDGEHRRHLVPLTTNKTTASPHCVLIILSGALFCFPLPTYSHGLAVNNTTYYS